MEDLYNRIFVKARTPGLPWDRRRCIFTARRNARIASAELATAIPSVRPSARLSVTRQHCVITTALSTVQLALSYSKMCQVL